MLLDREKPRIIPTLADGSLGAVRFDPFAPEEIDETFRSDANADAVVIAFFTAARDRRGKLSQ